MANFYKIGKFVHEFESTAASDVHVITVDPLSLEMTGTQLADTGIAGYHIKVIIIRTLTVYLSHTGATVVEESMSYRAANAVGQRTIVVPVYASQPASIRTLDGVSAWDLDVRITGESSEDTNAVDDDINIIIREPASISDLPARYKVFTTITAHGQDVA